MKSTSIPNTLLLNPEVKPLDKVVWLLIKYNNGTPMSQRNATSYLGISVNTYKSSLQRLIELGLLNLQEGVSKIDTVEVSKIDTAGVSKIDTLGYQNLTGGVSKIDTPSSKNDAFLTKEKEKFPPHPFIKEKEKLNNTSIVIINPGNQKIDTPSPCSGEQKKQLTLDNIERLRNEVETSQIKIEQYCKLLGLDRFSFIRMAGEVLDEWIVNEDTDITWKHLTNHMRVKMRNEQKSNSKENWRQQILAAAQKTITDINNRK